MNENRAIAECVVNDAQSDAITDRLKDAMYGLSVASARIDDAARAITVASAINVSRAARMKKVLRQPAMACSCVGMLVLGMVMWNGRDSVSETTDSPAMVIYREAVAFEKDGNIGRAFDKYVEAAKVATQTKDSDVFAMAQNRVVKTQRNG